MLIDYHECEKQLQLKLNTAKLGFVVLNDAGVPEYENLNQFKNKEQILAVAAETIQITTGKLKTLNSTLPEYMIFKGTKAFLILIPVIKDNHFYGIYGDNGLNVGMVRICLQNALEQCIK